ncbi:MAG: PRTRC system ThiF family protein [Anaerolineae bacterium]|nr:PRTRC system ThiF family protein [Anaerolineae bacterium]
MLHFDPHLNLRTITLVGCGGTGAQVARSLARMVYDLRETRRQAPQIVLIDPDVVETHNVGRQLFTEADVGQPKAQVLMRRFNLALGLNMIAICEPVDAERQFERWGNLIVGCVDNHLARQTLSQVSDAVWIDAGNHASAGQVVIGNSGDRDRVLRQLKGRDDQLSYLPHAGLLFPALLEPEVESAPQPGLSCGQLVAARSQDLLVNDWMAVVTAQYIYQMLHRQPIQSFISFISSDALSVRSIPITPEEIRTRLEANAS